MAITLNPIHTDVNDSESLWLYLPTSELQIERMLYRDGMESEDFARLDVQGDNLPATVKMACDLEQESVFDLNAMCAAISKLTQADRLKLGAAASFAKPESAAEIRYLAENLELFDFVPNVHTPEEYGRYMIQDSGHYEYDPNLEEFYDYERYGKLRMEKETGAFTEKGYVAYCGTLTLGELMAGGPAEQHQREQEFQMGGM